MIELQPEMTGIGIDIGGTKILAALGTEQGIVVEEMTLDTAKTREGLLRQLDEIVSTMADQSLRRGLGTVNGIGIGLPGRVSAETVEWVPNLPELNGLNLAEYADARWGVPTRLQNDGQLALYGEQWRGAAAGSRDVIMMTLGTGVGGAIMSDGRVIRGKSGTAGSLGWLTMALDDEGDPEQGWLERMASGTAINRRARLLPRPMSSRELFASAAGGDEEALMLVHRIGHCIGTAVANLASVFDPELVLIGGGVSLQLDALLPAMRDAMRRYGSPSTRDVAVRAAALLDRAGVIGALRLAVLPGA